MGGSDFAEILLPQDAQLASYFEVGWMVASQVRSVTKAQASGVYGTISLCNVTERRSQMLSILCVPALCLPIRSAALLRTSGQPRSPRPRCSALPCWNAGGAR